MRTNLFITLLFTAYCIEVGTFFVLWPWRGGWDHLWLQVSWPMLRHFLLHPAGRSLFTAFGIVHLVWGAHDLDLLVQRWLDRGRSLPAPITED
ncbi:MAG: hypothetical protein K8J08_10130 [Thermoanaerobaculia bacterium]|nr:hypothetical protein [Thermoanaerobaculia bacterium]